MRRTEEWPHGRRRRRDRPEVPSGEETPAGLVVKVGPIAAPLDKASDAAARA